MGYPLLWERGNSLSPVCFARSARSILLDAPTLFAHLPVGSVLRAFAFSTWVAVCLALSTLFCDVLHMRFDWHDGATLRAIALYGLSEFARQGAQTYALVLLAAFGFHAAARACGGHGSAVVALRAAAYGSAFLLYNVVTKLTAALAPFLQVAVLVIATVTQAYFCFSCLCIAAVEHYGVSKARAEVVAGTSVFVLVPSAAAATLLIAVVFAYSDKWLSFWLH